MTWPDDADAVNAKGLSSHPARRYDAVT